MRMADPAIYISSAAVALSLASLAWQVAQYRLVGPRLVIELFAVTMDQRGVCRETGPGGWPTGMADLDGRAIDGSGLEGITVELAHIRVTNVGRLPVSVRDVMLDLGPLHGPLSLQWWRRAGMGGGGTSLLGGSTDNVIRLETGAFASFVFAPRSTLSALADAKGRILEVRGSARAAGQRRARVSPWRKRWLIGPNQKAMDPLAEPSPEVAAYRALFQMMVRSPEDLEALQPMWDLVQPRLAKGRPQAAFEAISKELDVEHKDILRPAIEHAFDEYKQAKKTWSPKKAATSLSSRPTRGRRVVATWRAP
jgi:hypothetical protein